MTRLNMIPFKFPWAYKMFKDQVANTWTPEEIPMANDLHHYQRDMSPAVRHVFETSLANLTTSDVEIMDNVLIGITPALVGLGLADAPEVRMFLARQAFDEATHTASYQHCLESIGLDLSQQAELYTRWEKVPSIKAKVDFAAEVTEGFSSLVTVAAHKGPVKVGIRKFVDLAAFYWAVYEGAWFFGGFNPLFAIGHFYRQGTGTMEQITYIRRDETSHIAFGIELINSIRQEYFDEKDEESFMENLGNTFEVAAKLEDDFADFMLSSPILGYSADSHKAFFRWLCNLRANQLMLPPPFREIKTNPLPWLTEAAETKKEKNFFETRVTEYRTGGLDWDDN